MVFMCYDNKQGVALLSELFSGFKAFIDMKDHHGWISLFGYPKNNLYSPLILCLFTKCYLKWQTQSPIYNMSAGWDLYDNIRSYEKMPVAVHVLYMDVTCQKCIKFISKMLIWGFPWRSNAEPVMHPFMGAALLCLRCSVPSGLMTRQTITHVCTCISNWLCEGKKMPIFK